MTRCVYCNNEVDPHDHNTYRGVRGWEKKSVHGARRGGSDIVLREHVEVFACWSCIDNRRNGRSPQQGALL